MQEPIRSTMRKEIVDTERACLASAIIGGHENQLRTQRATRDVTQVLDVSGRHAAMDLIGTWRGNVGYGHGALCDYSQDGVKRPRHGMTPRTDCVIRAATGRGSVTPSTMSMPTDTARTVTDQSRRSPTVTAGGGSPYSIRFRWWTNDVNAVRRSTSTRPATQKRPVTTAARTRRNSDTNNPNGGSPTSAKIPIANNAPVHGITRSRPVTLPISVVS